MTRPHRLRLLFLTFFQIALVLAGTTEILTKPDKSSSHRSSQSPKQASGIERIWADPGPVEKLDLASGPGGRARAPKPPFTFVKEQKTGTSPKVELTDARTTRGLRNLVPR